MLYFLLLIGILVQQVDLCTYIDPFLVLKILFYSSLTLFGCTLSSPVLILTSLVNQNRTEEARNASAVDSNHFLNIKSFSGFLNVEEDANLFFWYFPASDANAPWVLWLQSEVGLTSLIGLFTNNGPFYHQRNKSRFATVDSLKGKVP